MLVLGLTNIRIAEEGPQGFMVVSGKDGSHRVSLGQHNACGGVGWGAGGACLSCGGP